MPVEDPAAALRKLWCAVLAHDCTRPSGNLVRVIDRDQDLYRVAYGILEAPLD